MVKAAYIHIPFCEHICHYCDFNKVFLKGQPVDEYINSLSREMELALKETPAERMKSIFVGGGTPTALNENQLYKLCNEINKNFKTDESTEYTFEANPGDLSMEKLKVLKEAGVNRLSFGVQTFNDELLKKIGRSHRASDVYRSIDAAKEAGFENISVDLIYSLPEQTLPDFKDTLEKAFTLGITHYSGYSLIIEPKTVFYNRMRKGNLPLPGEDLEAEMYELLIKEMEKHGFKQYEISNFAIPGYESRHNLTYWDNNYYYGFGAGAHGYVNDKRISNYGPLKKYMEPIQNGKLPAADVHHVSRTEKMEEEMFLGLRKTAGVSVRQFKEKFGESPLDLFHEQMDVLLQKELLEVNEDRIKLSNKGRFLGNEVFQSFIGVI